MVALELVLRILNIRDPAHKMPRGRILGRNLDKFYSFPFTVTSTKGFNPSPPPQVVCNVNIVY